MTRREYSPRACLMNPRPADEVDFARVQGATPHASERHVYGPRGFNRQALDAERHSTSSRSRTAPNCGLSNPTINATMKHRGIR
jgi:hypothetical protein